MRTLLSAWRVRRGYAFDRPRSEWPHRQGGRERERCTTATSSGSGQGAPLWWFRAAPTRNTPLRLAGSEQPNGIETSVTTASTEGCGIDRDGGGVGKVSNATVSRVVNGRVGKVSDMTGDACRRLSSSSTTSRPAPAAPFAPAAAKWWRWSFPTGSTPTTRRSRARSSARCASMAK